MTPAGQSTLCPKCKTLNPAENQFCGKCGSPTKKKTSRLLIGCLGLLGALILLFVIAAIVGVKPPLSSQGTSATSTQGSSAPTKAQGITMAKFLAIESGMSYRQVVEILGKSGQEMSRTDMAGNTLVMYSWKANWTGANMTAMFRNGKLISKAQFGLN